MRYTIVTDNDFDDLQLHVALAKNGLFLRPLRNGTARLAFLPPNIKHQTTNERLDEEIGLVPRVADGAGSIGSSSNPQGGAGVCACGAVPRPLTAVPG